MRATSPETGSVRSSLRKRGLHFPRRRVGKKAGNLDLLGGKNVYRKEVGVGVVRLRVGLANFVEDRVVSQAEVTTEEVN